MTGLVSEMRLKVGLGPYTMLDVVAVRVDVTSVVVTVSVSTALDTVTYSVVMDRVVEVV
jgi:hypothetical protein